ncbi:MAG: MerR family transcriptional regulator [Sulfuritalea sp.]|nr:MerR family transcriptional regulator [Sulfuritalea sp.]
MKIGELAALSGVSRDALRFYEGRGLIQSRRLENGYREYPPETMELLAYIRTAQRLGFSLAEVGESLPALWSAQKPDQAVAELLTQKIGAIDQRIAELKALKRDLVKRVAQTCPLTRD